ncbi:MAG: radical SAM protein [Proteobacteria bacterium]|nr:radical SAM protein [Pseudomonadota bacterium]
MIEDEHDTALFPLGIAYVSSALKKQGFSVHTLNLNYVKGEVAEIVLNQVRENRIDVVMTGGLSVQYRVLYDILRAAKQAETLTVVGGGIITAEPAVAMEALQLADIGVVGEGEITSCELAHALQNGSDLQRINGLVFRHGEHYVVTNPRKEIDNLNGLPWPDYEGFEIRKNIAAGSSINGMHHKNTVSMISSRSCPFNCTFCFHTSGHRYRKRSLDSFFEEMDYLVSQYSVECLFLFDELFSKNFERLKDFCTRIKPYNLKWSAAFRVDDVIPEMLPVIKESGCIQMGFGIESADNRVLKSMRKHITIEQTEKALKMVYDFGMISQGNLIFGDPEETVETARNSLNWWQAHKEYSLKLAPIISYPGTFIYKQACERGIIKDKVKFLRDGCPQINLSKMADQEFGNLMREIYDAQMDELRPVNYHIYRVYASAGRVDMTGECELCGEKNDWQNVKLFTTNRVNCRKCHQRLHIPFDSNILKMIEKNVAAILAQYSKVALWGMAAYAVNVIKKFTVLANENIYLIDISESAQHATILGKKIFSPAVINAQGIQAVVALPSDYYTNIKATVAVEHPGVKRVFNMANLIDRLVLPEAPNEHRQEA